MATPRAEAYAAASGAVVAGGRLAPPAWSQIASGMWAVIPFAATLNDIKPNGPSHNPNYPGSPEWWGGSGQQAIVLAWCGACYDEATDTIWLPLSGGHTDYAGNEPYKAQLWTETPTWVMVRPPSGAIGNVLTTNDGQELTGLYSDGRPRAVHSYNKPVFVPGVGPCMATQGGAAWTAAGGSSKFLKVHPVTGEATQCTAPTGGAITYSYGGATYDSLRHAVWWRSSNQGLFAKYDIAADTWTNYGSAVDVPSSTSLCYLPTHDCILWGNAGLAQKWAVFDCATQTIHQPTFTGTPGGNLRPGLTQPRWSAALGAVVAWDNDSSTTLVTRLTPPADPRTGTWTIDTLPVHPSNTVTPSVRTANGTYGRCIYSPRLGGLIVFNSTSGPHYFYKV